MTFYNIPFDCIDHTVCIRNVKFSQVKMQFEIGKIPRNV